MVRQSEVTETIAEFTLDDEEMILILKGLDIYGYSLVLSENLPELLKVKNVATKIISQLPKPELNS